MSKVVKALIIDDLKKKLTGVQDALLCDPVGLNSEKTALFRRDLRGRGISLMVVKGALARRATEGTRLASAFGAHEGSVAIVWGCEDFVSLCKQMVEVYAKKEYEIVKAHGGVMDGERLTQERIADVSKWPSRVEQLSMLLGQILSPGSRLLAQLAAPGGLLASQVSQIAEGKAGKEAGATPDAAPAA